MTNLDNDAILVATSKDPNEVNAAFSRVTIELAPLIRQISRRDEDLYSICLTALWEATKANDRVRPFANFANFVMRCAVSSERSRLRRPKHAPLARLMPTDSVGDEMDGMDRNDNLLSPDTVDKHHETQAARYVLRQISNHISPMERIVLEGTIATGADYHGKGCALKIIEYAQAKGHSLTAKQVDNTMQRIKRQGEECKYAGTGPILHRRRSSRPNC